MNEFFATLSDRKGQLFSTIIEHIQLSFIALFIATLIAVPIAILLTKTKTFRNRHEYCSCSTNNSITGTTWFDDTNFRNWETSGNYRLYALLPILRNTYTGIKEVDPSLIEAAKGIGMKPLRRLTKVELPIAMPVIMAGIRTAMVLIIGTATLAALIGAGGLGDLILLGIDRNNSALILIGAIPAALLAIILILF